MSATKGGAKKRGRGEAELSKMEQRMRAVEEDDFDPDLSNDIKGIMTALQHIKEKTQREGQKKKEETISSVAAEFESRIDDVKSKVEKDRLAFAKALSKSSKECENSLKNETDKFKAVYEKFCKDKAAHLQDLKDTIAKFEEEKERLFMRYEQLRKKEKNVVCELEKSCTETIAELEESLKRKKQDDKAFSILRKTLGSFLGNASDEDFPPDD